MLNKKSGLTKKKCLIFIDHDIVVRHFIVNKSFKYIEKQFDVTYVFNIDNETTKPWLTINPNELGLRKIIITNIPRSRMGSWYHIYAITVLNLQRGTENYKFRRKRIVTINGHLRTLWYELQSLPFIFKFIQKKWLERQNYWEPLFKIIAQEAPSVILHPTLLTGYFANELAVIGKKIGIPTAYIMNSWDNPSQKALVCNHPDLLFVWGKQTASHAVEYMKMEQKNIKIIGASQFDIYRKPKVKDDKFIRSFFKLPNKKPIILYGGVSKSINEMEHLKLLDRLITDKLINECHIIYRPHPWRGGLVDGEKSFFETEFKNISMDPTMTDFYQKSVSNPNSPLDMSDYENIRKLLSIIAGTISSMSTIQLETALFGKPSISYLSEKDLENKYGKSVEIGVRLAHFTALWDSPGIQFCHSEGDLARCVNRMLEIAEDKVLRKQIKSHAEREYVSFTGSSFAQNLNESITELVNNFGKKNAR